MAVRPDVMARVDEIELEDREERDLLEAVKRATIGEYDIYSRLGRGGMATVFLALELSLNRSVAIKVISPSALSSTTVIERFWLEARTAASLSHPHVIPIYSVRAVNGLHFFVMKHIQGGSLDVVLRNEGPFSYWLTQAIVGHVAGALAYAHRRGVIHRDIKPANIMLDDEGFAIVTDFGIAKVRDAAALTASGSMVGTPFYMSPEQFNGDTVDGRSDQYSLGIVAFELLTGMRPFKGESIPEVLRGHLLDRVPDVREFRHDCPTAIATLVNRMLCKQATDRFPSMEAVCSELEAMPRVNADRAREKISSLARTASMSSPKISQPVSPTPTPRTAGPRSESESKPLAASVQGRTIGFKKEIILSVVGLTTLAAIATAVVYSELQNPETAARETASVEPTSPALRAAPILSAAPDSNPPQASLLGEVKQPRDLRVAADTVASRAAARPTKSGVRPRLLPGAKTRQRVNSTEEPLRNRSVDSAASFPSIPVAAPVVPPPPAPPPPTVFGIGSRSQAAFLYIDGEQVGRIGRLRYFDRSPGRVHLQIQAEDCLTWDTVFVLRAGDTATVGYRNPRCSR